jgi:hypothetical protein
MTDSQPRQRTDRQPADEAERLADGQTVSPDSRQRTLTQLDKMKRTKRTTDMKDKQSKYEWTNNIWTIMKKKSGQ